MKDFPDIDEDKAKRKLSVRERIAIRILLAILNIVYPFKFSHQYKPWIESLFEEE